VGAASFRRAREAVEASPEVRFERVFVLRAALRSGTYRRAPREIADSMLGAVAPSSSSRRSR
jgi:anti-sigma28 factor (negative regulator of flagellin synthesis)